jgi:Ca-activated chloride channel family protein
MNFAQPAFLYGLFALPFLAAGLFVQYRRLRPLVRSMSLQKDAVIKTRYFYSGLFGLLALAALATAAAGPSLTLKYQEERLDGTDIVFAFDVSQSMNVCDVASGTETIARLDGARLIADRLLTAMQDRRTDFRYAVAVGKGEGILAIPLTYGIETVRVMLVSLSSSTISAAGTNVEKLTTAAASAFPPALSASYPAEKRIVVFTDGEALSGSFQNAVEKAQQEEITVIAVCLGSEQGGPIPIGVSEDGFPLFLRDKAGKNIISKAESGMLQEAVESGGGLFIGADDIDGIAAMLSEALFPQNGSGTLPEMREVQKKKDINFMFAALALLFFFMHKYAFYTHTIKKIGRKKPKSVSRILPLLLVLHSCAPVEAKFRLLEGNFLVARNMPQEAEASYTRALSLAEPGDIPYAVFALAALRLRYAETDDVSGEDLPNEAVFSLLEQAHAMIDTGNGDRENDDKAAYAFRHEHDEHHRELAYRIHYNAGIAHYYAGNAEEAAWEFRQALLIDPGRIEAKRNLEISLTLIENKDNVETSEVKSIRPVQEGESRGNSVLFDFIRQTETDKWKSWKWQGVEGDPSQDY